VTWKEKIVQAYLFWAPHPWVSLSTEYWYEDLDRNKDLSDGADWVHTHRVPLGINVFHPSGLGGSLRGTFVDQKGRFNRLNNLGVYQKGKDSFFSLDASISYRLPKRYGFMTFGVTNLTDQQFEYFDTDPDNATFIPDRVFFGRVTLALP
jgi:hypothetical protein